jgi:hypothetical protein
MVAVILGVLVVLGPMLSGAGAAGRNACRDVQVLAAARDAVGATCQCSSFHNHSDYVRCVAHAASKAAHSGVIPRDCAAAVKRCASNSTCGRPGTVACCRTDAKGRGTCSIKLKPSSCHKQGTAGSACISERPSCCDACTGGACTTDTVTTSTVTSTTQTTTTSSSTTTTTLACGSSAAPQCAGACPPPAACFNVAGMCACGVPSREAYKKDVAYLDRTETKRLYHELLRFHLARFRYKTENGSTPAHLGFLIDDVEPSAAVAGGHGDTVDLYAYASMAVAAIQAQAHEIEELKREVAELRPERNEAGTCTGAR